MVNLIIVKPPVRPPRLPSSARNLNLEYNRATVMPLRRDITDYGTPGDHLHGPLARGLGKLTQARGAPAGIEKDDAAAGSILDCYGTGGATISFNADVGGSSVTVQVTRRINFPFVLQHISAFSNQALSNLAAFRIKIAEDDDSTGGNLTSGVLITQLLGVESGLGWEVVTTPMDMWPNAVVREPGKFIKCMMEALTATAVQFQIQVDILLA